jgi:hypothetical protein
MTYARRISTDELAHTLPLLHLQRVRNDVLEACVEGLEHDGTPVPQDVEFWCEDGELVALAQVDELEAGVDHGNGSVLAEFKVGLAFHRCIVCGRPNRRQQPWCGIPCRVLLRDLVGRAVLRQSPSTTALDAAVEWAVVRRNAHVGWHIPLTREIAEALYRR